jgi:hypothetical protein
LTLTALDASGTPPAHYAWDLDGNGYYERTGGTSLPLGFLRDGLRCSVAVRITDAHGRASEARFHFQGTGQAGMGPTANTYRQYFLRATPDMPREWRVHHTLPQQFAERFLRERNINVHDLQYLRGVPPLIHDEITAAQRSWLALKVKQHDHFDKIPLDEVIAFARDIERDLGSFMLLHGPRQADAVTRINNLVKSKAITITMDRANRWRRLGLPVAAAIPVIVLLTQNAEAFQQMKNFDPDRNAAFQDFVEKYQRALELAVSTGDLPKRPAEQLVESFFRFGRELGLDTDTLNKAQALIHAKLDTMYYGRP